ncbi:MAG: PAS domain S-box protein, partial [Gammaproteobacteria bacterium]
MANRTIEAEHEVELRCRAFSRLTGRSALADVGNSASAALRVLHDLASSTATAPDALAVLHELQVHQVELDLQDENLRTALAELEADLNRQRDLYDLAPVACFTVGPGTAIDEPNLAAARLLGCERDALRGQPFDSFIAANSGETLQGMLARVGPDKHPECRRLNLSLRDGTERTVWASVNADPVSGRYRVALMALEGFEQA